LQDKHYYNYGKYTIGQLATKLGIEKLITAEKIKLKVLQLVLCWYEWKWV
jgi:hypothetical protein